MKAFTITKNITPIKQSPSRAVINILIIIVAIPVIIIAALSIALYLLFSWLKDKVTRKSKAIPSEEQYHLEIEFFKNEHLVITFVEDENDLELSRLNELWQEQVYDEDSYLYRVKTIPLVQQLEGTICCMFYKELGNGLLLQLIPNQPAYNRVLSSQLVILDFTDFQLVPVGEAGAFFLYNEHDDTKLIKGFSKTERVTMQLIPVNDTPI